MLKLADRVKESTITQGSGLYIALNGAIQAFQTFATTIGDGNSTYYTIENNNQFEVGIGTYRASDNTLARTTVLNSSNNNQRIVLDSVSIVFCTYPASQAVFLEDGYIKGLSPQYSGVLFPDTTVINSAFLSGVVPNASLPANLVFTNDSRLSDTRVPKAHTHVIVDVSGLQSALDNKQPSGNYAASVHNHTASQITDFAVAVSSVAQLNNINAVLITAGTLSDDRLSANIVRTVDSRLSDARTPLYHAHNIVDVSGLQTALDGKQASGNYAPLIHSHAVSDITELQTSLDNKQPSGNYANISHTHIASQITDFGSAVSGYAPPTTNASLLTTGTLSDSLLSANVVLTNDSRLSDARTPLAHTHTSSNITDFNSSVSGLLPVKNIAGSGYVNVISNTGNYTVYVTGLQPSGSYASSVHSHTVSDVTGLQTVLDGKQPSGSYATAVHVHAISDVTNLQSTLDGKQASGSYASSVHSHTVSDVTGLQSTLDLKAPLANPTFTGTVNGITKSMVGLGNVDNTSDASKPISTATQTALDNKAASSHTHTASNITDFNVSVSGLVNGIYAPLSSPTLTGVPLAPTASSGTNTNQIASTSFVRTEISNLVSSAPSTLDTLNELATALGNDPNFATTITNNLASKAALSGATFTGTISSPSGSFSQSLKVNGVDVSVAGHTHIIGDVTGLQTALDNKQASGSYAALVHTHAISDVTGLQSALDLKQPSGSYAASSHTHTASQITDFNSSVSGLLPVKNITPSSYIDIVSSTGNFTISVTGLQPAGSYAAATHSHSISDVTGLQTSLDGKQASGSYAASSHTHTASQITDFATAVSGYAPPTTNASLLTTGTVSDSLLSANIVRTSDSRLSDARTPTTHSHVISDVTGLQTALDGKQASGSYAASSHTHTASNITDFNSSVSGLLPVTSIIAGTNITIGVSAGAYTINSTASGGGGSSDIDAGTYPLIIISIFTTLNISQS